MEQHAFEFGDLVNYEGCTWVIDKTLDDSEGPSADTYFLILPLEYQDPDKYDNLIKTGEYEQVCRKVLQSELVQVGVVEDIIFTKQKASLDYQIQSAATRAAESRPDDQAKAKETTPER